MQTADIPKLRSRVSHYPDGLKIISTPVRINLIFQVSPSARRTTSAGMELRGPLASSDTTCYQSLCEIEGMESFLPGW